LFEFREFSDPVDVGVDIDLALEALVIPMLDDASTFALDRAQFHRPLPPSDAEVERLHDTLI
jgi:hypothetical protein